MLYFVVYFKYRNSKNSPCMILTTRGLVIRTDKWSSTRSNKWLAIRFRFFRALKVVLYKVPLFTFHKAYLFFEIKYKVSLSFESRNLLFIRPNYFFLCRKWLTIRSENPKIFPKIDIYKVSRGFCVSP